MQCKIDPRFQHEWGDEMTDPSGTGWREWRQRQDEPKKQPRGCKENRRELNYGKTKDDSRRE
jgi:hypothetical protein